jgi:hypothetical protein
VWRSIQLNASPPKRAAPRLLPLIQTTVLCLRAVDEIDRSFKGAPNVSSGTPKILELLPVVFFRCEYCLRNTTGFSISLRLYQTKLSFVTRQTTSPRTKVVLLGGGSWACHRRPTDVDCTTTPGECYEKRDRTSGAFIHLP